MAAALADIKRRLLPSAPPTVAGNFFSTATASAFPSLRGAFPFNFRFKMYIFTSDVVRVRRCIFRSAKRLWRTTSVGEPLIKSRGECV